MGKGKKRKGKKYSIVDDLLEEKEKRINNERERRKAQKSKLKEKNAKVKQQGSKVEAQDENQQTNNLKAKKEVKEFKQEIKDMASKFDIKIENYIKGIRAREAVYKRQIDYLKVVNKNLKGKDNSQER